MNLTGVEKPTLTLLYTPDYRKYFGTRNKLTQCVEPRSLSPGFIELTGFSPEASTPRRVCAAYAPRTDPAQAMPGGRLRFTLGVQRGIVVAGICIGIAGEGQHHAMLGIPRGTLSQRTPATSGDP